jgi:hypothetical protein
MSILPRQPADLDWDHFTWAKQSDDSRAAPGAAFGKTREAKVETKRLQELEGATVKAKEELFARNIRVLVLNRARGSPMSKEKGIQCRADAGSCRTRNLNTESPRNS